MSGLREHSPATGPSGDTWVVEGTPSWPRLAPAPPGLPRALPGLPRAPAGAGPGPASASGHRAPGGLGRACPGPPALPAAHGPGAAGLPIVSMGDDFQGEISSSDESLSFTAARKMSSPPGSALGCSPVAFKFTPLSLPDTCLNQYLPLQVAGRMCPALHTALLKSTKINTIIEIFSS